MAISKVADRATSNSTTRDYFVDFALTDLTVGNVLIIRVSAENSGAAGAATAIAVTNQSGAPINTGTMQVFTQNRTTGAQYDGVTCFVIVAVITATSGTVRITWGDGSTSGSAVSAAVAEEWTGIDTATACGVVGTPVGASTGGAAVTPSVTDASVAISNLAYGVVAVEGQSTEDYTQDPDTNNGSWSSLTRVGSDGINQAASQTIWGGYKVATATGSQTYNIMPGTGRAGRDMASLIIEFQNAFIITAAGGIASAEVVSSPGLLASINVQLGPQTYLSDSFNRADSTLPGSTADAAYGGASVAWQSLADSTQLQISTNKVMLASGNTSARAAFLPLTHSDVEVSATVFRDTGSITTLYARADAINTVSNGGPNTTYGVRVLGDGEIRIIKIVNGIFTNPYSSAGVVPPGGAKVAMRCIGDQISIYVNDVLITTITDSIIASGSFVGVQLFGAAGTYVDTYKVQSTVSNQGIVSAENVPSLVLDQIFRIFPVAIGSAEILEGATVIPGAVALTPSAIASTEVVPSPNLLATIIVLPGGVATAEAVPSPAVSMVIAVTPPSVASQETFGNSTITSLIALLPAGIVSAEALGAATITARISLSPGSIASQEGFGNSILVPGEVRLTPTSIGSAEQFGLVFVMPPGIPWIFTDFSNVSIIIALKPYIELQDTQGSMEIVGNEGSVEIQNVHGTMRIVDTSGYIEIMEHNE